MQGIIGGVGDAIKNTSLKYMVTMQIPTDGQDVANGYKMVYMFTTRRIKDFKLTDTLAERQSAMKDMCDYLRENAQLDPNANNINGDVKVYPAFGCVAQGNNNYKLTYIIDHVQVIESTRQTLIYLRGRGDDWLYNQDSGKWECMMLDERGDINLIGRYDENYSGAVESDGDRICTPLY